MALAPTIETTNRLLRLEHRPPELGRIRLGQKTEDGYPSKLDTFRLTSGSRAYLEAAAAIYGGTVQAWEDAPDEGFFELYTEAKDLNVLIPRSLRTVSQAYELWKGGTCERRCDGQTEEISGSPCLCDPNAMECKPVTRVSVMLHRLPGLGTWRLDTGGWHAATSIPATIQLLTQLSEKDWIPAILRLEQRSAKKRGEDGKVMTHRFVVPVLDLPNVTLAEVVARQGSAEAPQLPAERPQQPTAAERVAQRAAAITSGSGAQPRSEAGPEREEGDATEAWAGGDEPPPPAAPDEGDPGPVRAEMPGSRWGSGSTTTPGSPDEDDAGTPSSRGSTVASKGSKGEEPGAMPADASDGTSSPSEASPAERCAGFDDELGRCTKDAGHAGNHADVQGQTWS